MCECISKKGKYTSIDFSANQHKSCIEKEACLPIKTDRMLMEMGKVASWEKKKKKPGGEKEWVIETWSAQVGSPVFITLTNAGHGLFPHPARELKGMLCQDRGLTTPPALLYLPSLLLLVTTCFSRIIASFEVTCHIKHSLTVFSIGLKDFFIVP